jgi:UDP-N-acetylglucosamine--N-acetylmuramyl-(pentapeptide) pyrophosphoryl-undecaprenol N-acetylglucosamine transferase
MSQPVVISAGGTGGHMFPALALAAELERRGQAVALICDRRGVRYVPAGRRHHVIAAGSPSGTALQRAKGALALATGIVQSLVLLRRLSPAAIAAFGGYAAVPVGLAAGMLRLPLLVHEQNAVLGRANRLIARRAAQVALSFAATRHAETIAPARRLVTGNPVRPEIASRWGDAYVAPSATGSVEVLVFGGSQGARALSEALPAAIALLSADQRRRVRLTQQCRPEDLERVGQAYRDLGVEVVLQTFFDDLPARLAKAHLVVSRSGASSLAEILALGRPSILIPYRFAAEDHQRANAAAVADAGAGWVLDEATLTGAALAGLLSRCLEQPDALAAMAARARALGRPDAAQALADAIEPLVPGPSARPSVEAMA